MKKILNLCTISIIFLLFLLLLSGCGNKKDNKQNLSEKINTEILYLDNELIDIANSLNGIDYAKYQVISKKNENPSQSGKSETEAGGAEKQEQSGSDGESESGGNSSDDSQSSDDSGDSQGKEDSGSKQQSSGSNKNDKSSDEIFTMQANNILDAKKEINWEELKNKIENLYTSWTVMAMDLNEIGVNLKDITSFGENLDLVATAIKKEDKNETMNTVITLYEFLPRFMESYMQNKNDSNVLYCKYNLLLCYKYAELEDWKSLQQGIEDLKMAFSNVNNNINEYEGKRVNIKSAEVIIKEMENSTKLKEKEIFLIKYKNLIQEFNSVL